MSATKSIFSYSNRRRTCHSSIEALSYVSLYEASIFFLAFSTAFGGLYIVENSEILPLILKCIDVLFDLVLVVTAIAKANRIRSLLAVAVAVVCGILVAFYSGSFILLKLILLAVCASGENAGACLDSLKRAFALVLFAGIIFALLGFGSGEAFRRNGLAFGFTHPNQAALIAVVTLSVMIAERSVRSVKFQFKPIYLLLLVYIFLTGSRTALLSAVAIIILSSVVSRGMGAMRLSPLMLGSPLLPIVACAFSLVTAVFVYQVPFFQQLNLLFSTRIWLNWYALDAFDVTLFGQQTSFHVAGVYDDLRNAGNITTTIDCTYIAGLLRYGIVAMAIWLGLYTVSIYRCWRKGLTELAVILLVFSLYAFTESQLMDPLINFGLIAAVMAQEKGQVYFRRDSNSNDDGRSTEKRENGHDTSHS